jgi:hypothetical protein
VLVAVGTQSARGRLGGNDVSAPFAGVFELRDDKVVEARPFGTKVEALEAAGLEQ